MRTHLPDAQAVYLHGSQATGTARSGSDLDLAILLPPGVRPDPETWLDALSAVSAATETDADLADLRSASSELHAELLRYGRRLWDDGTGAAETFEMHALSDYVRLREERASIEGRIRETGRVHG